MPSNRRFNFGPLALTNTYTTNILNPGAVAAATNNGSLSQIIYLTKITVVNKGAAPATFRLWKDATGGNTAGKELAYDRTVAVGAKEELYFPNPLILTTADFLVGGASAATTLTISGEGETGL